MTPPMLPLQLVVMTLINGTPLPGAWVSVTLPMSSKNPYRLLFGPASARGSLTITRDEILREVKKVRDLFLMDYIDLSIGWNGVLEIRALNRSDIARVLLAYDTYRSAGVYPSDLSEKLAELDLALETYEGGELSIAVTVRGGDETKVVEIAQPVD